MGVTLFTGRPGSGKTYRVVYNLMRLCKKFYIFHNIEGLNESFFDDGAFIKRWDNVPGFLTLDKQKEISGYIQEKFQRAMLVVIDEAQSHGFSVRNQLLLDWISYHRHLGQEIYLISQTARSIFPDFVGRCQFEIRAKRGIATKQFIYNYMIGDESFKTDRVPKSGALFKAYESFKIEGERPASSSIVYYIVGLVGFCVVLGVYQVCFGIPHLFGKSGGVIHAVSAAPPVAVAPVVAKPVVARSVRKVDNSCSLSSVVNGRVVVQLVRGGGVRSLDDLYPGYRVVLVGRKFVDIDYEDKMVRICSRHVDSSGTDVSDIVDSDPGPNPVVSSKENHHHGK